MVLQKGGIHLPSSITDAKTLFIFGTPVQSEGERTQIKLPANNIFFGMLGVVMLDRGEKIVLFLSVPRT